MLLPQLRASTASLHTRVELSVRLADRLKSLDSYANLLARYYGFYGPIEARLQTVVGSTSEAINLESRLKAPLLRDDLLALGHTETQIDMLPVCTSLPELNNLDEAFGCLYVLEGATLGGKIVRKEVERTFGLVAGKGCAFFSSYGDDVGPMWRSFCETLEAHSRHNPDGDDRVIAAAIATFIAFEQWLTG